MSDAVIVLGATTVGGLFILKVIWNFAVEKLLDSSDYDGINDGDGTGTIWK